MQYLNQYGDHGDDNSPTNVHQATIVADKTSNNTEENNLNVREEEQNNTIGRQSSERYENEGNVVDEQYMQLQEKVIQFLTKSQQAGVSILDNLHSQKEFHNPELLQKMVDNQLSDEYGSHYPTEKHQRIGRDQLLRFTQHQINQTASSNVYVVTAPQSQSQQQQQQPTASSSNPFVIDEQQAANYRAHMQQRSKYRKR